MSEQLPHLQPSSQASLIVIGGCSRQRGRGMRIPLGAAPLSIGREGECHICIDDPRVSRQQAIVFHNGVGYSVRDTHSRNGTIVNEVAIHEKFLAHEDRILIGPVTLLYVWTPDHAEPSVDPRLLHRHEPHREQQVSVTYHPPHAPRPHRPMRTEFRSDN
jgi:pSer/pThr/pTyr-binding forkhead associated (FHA) protein